MALTKSNHLYDMGAMNYNENISKKIAEFTRENLFVGIPARVVGVQDYENLQCLDVQPVINDVYVKHDATVLQANILKKVFVKLPHGGGFSIKLPVSKGDLVTLNYAHKDLGDFLDSTADAQIDQSIFKIANIEDCWIELGFGTRKENQSPSATNMIIEGDNTTITITPSGEVTCVTSGTSMIQSAGHTIDAPSTNITGTLTVDGATTVNNTVTATGNVSAPTVAAATGLTVAGTEMRSHVHGGVSEGDKNTDPV